MKPREPVDELEDRLVDMGLKSLLSPGESESNKRLEERIVMSLAAVIDEGWSGTTGADTRSRRPSLGERWARLWSLGAAAAVVAALAWVLWEGPSRGIGDQGDGREKAGIAGRSEDEPEPVVVRNQAELDALSPETRFLRAEGDFMDDEAVAALALRCPQLESLEVDWGRLGDAALVTLSKREPLRRLRLNQCARISDRGVEAIARHAGLRSLSLRGFVGQVSVGPDGDFESPYSRLTGAAMALLSRMPALEELDLFGNGFDDAAVSVLVEAAPRNLRRLDLGHNAVTAAGVALLVKLERLEGLDLEGYPWLDDETVKILAGHPNLRALSIAGHGFTSARFGDSGLAALAEAGRLRELGVGYCAAGRAGWMRVAGMSSLRRLRLERPAAFDDGCLAALAGHPLDELVLLYCGGITAKGLEKLDPDAIGVIDLRGSKVPTDAVRAFAARGRATRYVDEDGKTRRPE